MKVLMQAPQIWSKVTPLCGISWQNNVCVIKENNPPSSFFSKTLSIIFKIQFFILFSETITVSLTKSWVSQNNRKYRSEFEWAKLNGMAPANHIQAAASWLATAAQPTKWYPPRNPLPGPHFFVAKSNFSEAWMSSAERTSISINMAYKMAISV